MSDWLHNLPVAWMAVVIFGVTYLIAVAIYTVVMALATGERARVQGGLPRYAASAWYTLRPLRRIHCGPGLER